MIRQEWFRVWLRIVIPVAAALCLMSSMGCSPVVEYRYVERVIPASPPSPEYYAITWQAAGCPAGSGECYFLDDPGARRLLKNVELLAGQKDECLAILDGLRSSGTTTP